MSALTMKLKLLTNNTDRYHRGGSSIMNKFGHLGYKSYIMKNRKIF